MDGLWKNSTIDTYFPYRPEGGPMFTFGRANELWYQILEKSYAKALGGYWNMRGRSVDEILYDITGCPCEMIDIGVTKIAKSFLTY